MRIFSTGAQLRDIRTIEGDSFTCSHCGEVKPILRNGGTGYAITPDDTLHCYACVGLEDARRLAQAKPGERFVHYLTKADDGAWQVSNWPGTFKVRPTHVSRGRHNIGRVRFDVWFTFEGKRFHGVNIGDNQILRIRALKG